MAPLTQQDIDYYQENGYLVLKNLIPAESINSLMEAFKKVVLLEISMKENPSIFEEDPLHTGLIKLKRDFPSSSAWIYQTINNHLIFKQFIFHLPLEQYILQLIKLDKSI